MCHKQHSDKSESSYVIFNVFSHLTNSLLGRSLINYCIRISTTKYVIYLYLFIINEAIYFFHSMKFKLNIFCYVITVRLYTSKQIFKIAEMLFTQTKIQNYNCYSKIKYLYHFLNIERLQMILFQTSSQK